MIAWKPPRNEVFKINFDGSVNKDSVTAGFIIGDYTSNTIRVAATNLGKSSVIVAEATAMRNGIKAALELNIRDIIIEGDNMVVINTVKGEFTPSWPIDFIIREIKYLLRFFNSWEIRHIYDETNGAADWAANWGHTFLHT